VLVSLGVRLLHELHNQIFDHLFDFTKRICPSPGCDQCQVLAANLLRAALQELHKPLPDKIFLSD